MIFRIFKELMASDKTLWRTNRYVACELVINLFILKN
jgi:hypothetical protein